MGIYKNGEIYPNYYMMSKGGRFISYDKLITSADLFFTDKRLAIFCDGEKFHDSEKDKRISDSLSTLGITSLRLTLEKEFIVTT